MKYFVTHWFSISYIFLEVLHHFSGIAFGNPSRFVILSEAKNLKLLIINALDSSLCSE
jgi:hypothetical protein